MKKIIFFIFIVSCTSNSDTISNNKNDSLIFCKKIDNFFATTKAIESKNNVRNQFYYIEKKEINKTKLDSENQNIFPNLFLFPNYDFEEIKKNVIITYFLDSLSNKVIIQGFDRRIINANGLILSHIKIEKWSGLSQKDINRIQEVLENSIHSKRNNNFILLKKTPYYLEIGIKNYGVTFMESYFNPNPSNNSIDYTISTDALIDSL